ncbi:L-2-hydroxyglutarate dehydrogenase, mitochondrial-like [Saccoglossus kowalevskii]|uniref:L-2-hydroxyglutarate dehydrogenase, mitochondrial n=1 Tax=Saccoglossus kowalevskii TaxID=10224 RepID=A0ABM0GZX0_SACKO|nr:PREDICTED: l-2-hydroxyglutarate dehydrogenase, mitochondrial-like [Saccoglossus kowalevskii]
MITPVRIACRRGIFEKLPLLPCSQVVLCKQLRVVSSSQQRRQFTSSNGSASKGYDVCIIGGGIVGMATARELILRHPMLKFITLEKENILAPHQSGHNSGVIHAGIYYQPGSLKAKLCVEGLEMCYKYCDDNNIPYKKCGKLIVAVNQEQASRLDGLYERGLQNNVKGLKIIGPEEIREREPYCRGIKSLESPNTGIVDFGHVTRSYGENFKDMGGNIKTGHKVTGFHMAKESVAGSKEGLKYPVTVVTKKGNFNCRYVVTCGGLHADRLAELSGCSPVPKIVPFRGEYLLLKPEKNYLVRGNIYPVPDPRFPFLGVHFTPRIDGAVWLGPNAVLAFKREGYGYTDFSASDLFEALCYSGLRKLVFKHLAYGMGEIYRGLNIAAQVNILRKFVPELKFSDVNRGPTGVRAQALGEDGSLVDDFVFDTGKTEIGERILHVRNAPSPAATSSLAIAKMVADHVEKKFEL